MDIRMMTWWNIWKSGACVAEECKRLYGQKLVDACRRKNHVKKDHEGES